MLRPEHVRDFNPGRSMLRPYSVSGFDFDLLMLITCARVRHNGNRQLTPFRAEAGCGDSISGDMGVISELLTGNGRQAGVGANH